MRTFDHEDVEPLPPPIRPAVAPRPVHGRSGWFYGPKDVPYYSEPEKPKPAPAACRGLSPAVLHAAAAVLRFRSEK